MMFDKTYLYLMETDNAIKIGVSKNPEVRRNCLQTGNNETITITDTICFEDSSLAYKAETILHTMFSQYKVDVKDRRGGKEWFNRDVLRYLIPFNINALKLINECIQIGTVKPIDDIQKPILPSAIKAIENAVIISNHETTN